MNILTQNQTMTSKSLLEMINAVREDFNEPIIRLNKFNEKIEDELEGDYYTKSVVQNSNNTESTIYHLTIEQCTLIGMRESKSVRRNIILKLKGIERKEQLKVEKKAKRADTKIEYKPMTDAIALDHENPKPYHFSNEADMINRIILGCTSSKFRKENDISDKDAIRDYMTAQQLDAFLSLQRANTVYIEDGIEYQKRKEKLQSLFDRKHSKLLINEVHLING